MIDPIIDTLMDRLDASNYHPCVIPATWKRFKFLRRRDFKFGIALVDETKIITSIGYSYDLSDPNFFEELVGHLDNPDVHKIYYDGYYHNFGKKFLRMYFNDIILQSLAKDKSHLALISATTAIKPLDDWEYKKIKAWIINTRFRSLKHAMDKIRKGAKNGA